MDLREIIAKTNFYRVKMFVTFVSFAFAFAFAFAYWLWLQLACLPKLQLRFENGNIYIVQTST